jgi:signal transduction histidine kinase
MRDWLNQLMTVSSLDAEDGRRRKLLNILLLGVTGLCVLILVFGAVYLITGNPLDAQTQLLFVSIGVTLVAIVVIYLINRYWSGPLASSLFLAVLIGTMATGDTPEQVVTGQVLFLFTIPIIMASVLIRPWASFIVAAVVTGVITLVGSQVGIQFNPTYLAGFMAIALVSWLAARSLEQALSDLRKINNELDQLVAERTRELYQALRQVSAESSKNEAILQSIADGVVVFDAQQSIFASNPSISRLIQRPASEIVGSDFKKLMGESVKEPDQEMLLERLNSTEGSDESINVEWGKRVLSISLAPVLGSMKEVLGKVMVARDMTAQAELDRMKSAFVSMASHELRTPLNAILGYSDMIRSGAMGGINPEQEKGLERVMSNGERMLTLVNNLLDQAQIEAGQINIRINPFEVRKLVDDVISTMRVLTEQKGIDIVYTIADDVPLEMESDQQRLHQIVMNLVGNAVKFTDKGQVAIRVFRLDDLHWGMDISDTGIGIPDDAQAFVFETFRQVNDPSTRKHQGSGLGLSIVKQLVELLHGTITLESKMGEGTTFHVVLPVSAPVLETA